MFRQRSLALRRIDVDIYNNLGTGTFSTFDISESKPALSLSLLVIHQMNQDQTIVPVITLSLPDHCGPCIKYYQCLTI